MCYVIESKQGFDFESMTGSIEKRDMDMDFMKIWITANYDFLSLTPQCSRMAMQIRKFEKGTFLNFEKKIGLACW